tara:strand:+ start:3875 stop:4486 length:612 start_codon:yes stop_codon:yes gene_type:complete
MFKKPVIVFEGIEGSGKSLHCENVARYLKKKRIKYIKLREPGGNKNSELIRKLILNKNSNFNKNTDLLLYLAARSESIRFLKKNYRKKIILIDRFIDSTIAYQHYGFGINLSIIKKINQFLLKNFKPDFTFLHTVNSKNMDNRLKKRKNINRYDKFNKSFYNKVQNGFIKLSKDNKRYKIINSNISIQLNKTYILEKIDSLIK